MCIFKSRKVRILEQQREAIESIDKLFDERLRELHEYEAYLDKQKGLIGKRCGSCMHEDVCEIRPHRIKLDFDIGCVHWVSEKMIDRLLATEPERAENESEND